MQNLERLEELWIGKNYFETIPEQAFRGLRKLRVLDLSDSVSLTAVSNGALAANTALERLVLSGCGTIRLPAAGLAGLTSLTSLGLANLGWTAVPRSLVHWEDIATGVTTASCNTRQIKLKTVLIALLLVMNL